MRLEKWIVENLKCLAKLLGLNSAGNGERHDESCPFSNKIGQATVRAEWERLD